jgi:hypothetical protein
MAADHYRISGRSTLAYGSNPRTKVLGQMGDWGLRRWLLHSGRWNVVRVERPQASERSSHEPLCRSARIAGRDCDLRVNATGRIVNEVRAPREPEALISTLRGTDLPLERVGLKARSLPL